MKCLKCVCLIISGKSGGLYNNNNNGMDTYIYLINTTYLVHPLFLQYTLVEFVVCK